MRRPLAIIAGPASWSAARMPMTRPRHFSQALALTPATDAAARCQLLLAREAVYNWQGKRAAQVHLAALAALASTMNDRRVQAEVSLRRASYAL